MPITDSAWSSASACCKRPPTSFSAGPRFRSTADISTSGGSRITRLADVGARLEAALPFYAGLCGRTLARAHARAGDAVAISAYIGDGNEFDKAIAEFAIAYADQTERDWRTFLDAIKAGRITTQEPRSST